MKKIFLLFLMLTTSFFMVSCSEDDENGGNPLVGTLWAYDDVTAFTQTPYTSYIEFIDGNTVKVWDTYSSSVICTGTYSIEGNKITFYNLHHNYWDRYYMYATYSAKSLTIYYSFDKDYSTGPYSDTYIKQ